MATSRSVIASVNHTDARQESRPMSQSNCDWVSEHDWRECYALAIPFDEPSLRRERLVEKSLQLRLMLGHQAGGRRGRCGAADVARPGHGNSGVRQNQFEHGVDKVP